MKIRTPYLVLFLLFVVLGVYYPSIFAPTNTVDDRRMITALLNDDSVSLMGVFLPGGSGYYYRPLLGLSFYVDNYVWGFLPSFMHLENILMHAMNVILVFFVAREIFRRYELWNELPSLSAALLFALHPINTEPVNWISGRTDLLAGTFILASLFLLLRALATNSFTLCILATSSFMVSCFAKDSALFFFPAALLMIWHFDERRGTTLACSLVASLRERCFFYASFSASAVSYFLIRRIAFAKADLGIATAVGGVIGKDSHVLYTLKVIVKLLGFYVKKLFLPWPLNFAIIGVSDYYIVLGVMLLIVCMYLVYCRHLSADLFLMSVCIISPSFLVALSKMAWTPIAERYLYVPSASFSIGITLVICCLSRRYHMQTMIAVLTVMVFALTAHGTVIRNITWQDNLTLFQDTINKTPNFAPVKNELAMALMEHGRYEESARLIRENIAPQGARNRELADFNRAALLAGAGDLDGARQLLRDKLNPASETYSTLLSKLIDVDMQLIDRTADGNRKNHLRQELIGMLTKLQEHTGDPYYLYKLGQQYLWAGRRSEARNCFAKASELASEDAFYKMSAKKMADKLSQ